MAHPEVLVLPDQEFIPALHQELMWTLAVRDLHQESVWICCSFRFGIYCVMKNLTIQTPEKSTESLTENLPLPWPNLVRFWRFFSGVTIVWGI